jgi:hypothetical protein
MGGQQAGAALTIAVRQRAFRNVTPADVLTNEQECQH